MVLFWKTPVVGAVMVLPGFPFKNEGLLPEQKEGYVADSPHKSALWGLATQERIVSSKATPHSRTAHRGIKTQLPHFNGRQL